MIEIGSTAAPMEVLGAEGFVIEILGVDRLVKVADVFESLRELAESKDLLLTKVVDLFVLHREGQLSDRSGVLFHIGNEDHEGLWMRLDDIGRLKGLTGLDIEQK